MFILLILSVWASHVVGSLNANTAAAAGEALRENLKQLGLYRGLYYPVFWGL